ncbi:Arm DNA-binding domain-containing protein [Sphingobium sp.]|uniref:Arm DNA-binding domain-containing protein n=1 Tax=Sphingobium sp. TaxID=1912891 RepID=UPI003BB6CC34
MADADGLYLAVQTNGTKLWRMNYRYLDRQKTLYFGAWPEVGRHQTRVIVLGACGVPGA